MAAVKNFFIYFLIALVFMGIIYGLGAFLYYLFSQDWGIIGFALLVAVLMGIAGIIRGNEK
jgi:hypothetical protein